MSVRIVHSEERVVLYEYDNPAERPQTPDALQYQETYQADDGRTFYRLYEFAGDNRKENFLSLLDAKIEWAQKAGDSREVERLTSFKKSYEQ